jgi:hypothetical protein
VEEESKEEEEEEHEWTNHEAKKRKRGEVSGETITEERKKEKRKTEEKSQKECDGDGEDNDDIIGHGNEFDGAVYFKKLISTNDHKAVFVALEELNLKYNDCMTVRANTERTIEIDLKKFNARQSSSVDDLRKLLKSITMLPDIAIVFTQVPDIGRRMLDILQQSTLGNIANRPLDLFEKGMLLGSSTGYFSLNDLIKILSTGKGEEICSTFEIKKIDGTRKIVKIEACDFSMYYKDLSTQRVDPAIMESYFTSMPKMFEDMSSFRSNDFSKYVSFPIQHFSSHAFSSMNLIIYHLHNND